MKLLIKIKLLFVLMMVVTSCGTDNHGNLKNFPDRNEPHITQDIPGAVDKPQIIDNPSEVKEYRYPLYAIGSDNSPLISDVNQPNYAVCAIYAFLYALAAINPVLIKDAITRINDGFLVTIYYPSRTSVMIKDKWLDLFIDETKPHNRGIWPEVLASVFIERLAQRYDGHDIDHGFTRLVEQIKSQTGPGTNITIAQAIEMLNEYDQDRKKEYIKNLKRFANDGFIESSKIMMDFWSTLIGKRATTYRLPWDSGKKKKKIIEDLSSPARVYQFIKEKLSQAGVGIAYVSSHARTILENGIWRKESGEYESVRKSGIYVHHNYAVIDATKDDHGEYWITLANPHERGANLVPAYTADGRFTMSTSIDGKFVLNMKDFMRIFYTITID